MYRALRNRLGAPVICLIVQSQGPRRRLSHNAGVIAVHLPTLRSELLNYAWFVAAAVVVGLRLIARRRGLIMASDPTGSGPATVLLRWLTRLPLLVHLQGDLFHLPAELPWLRRKFARLMAGFVCRRADLVRCVSRQLMRAAAAEGVDPSRLAYAPSRCDTELFTRERHLQDAARVRARWNVAADARVAVFVGALTVHKGVGYLVRAASRVAAVTPGFVLLLVGGGPLDSDLRREARELRVEGAIRFCGSISYDEVPAYLASAELFVLPSLDEGLPRAILEAMAMRLPVVATAVGGVPEVVTDGRTGTLVTAGDVASLSEAIIAVLRDPQRARILGENARARVEASYSFEYGVDMLASVIAGLLPSSPGTAGR